jgi:high-affinity iron transporter
MLPTFIIMFREILEIAIILSIIVAATRGVAGRGFWIWAGIGGGLVGAGIVAFFTDKISDLMEGMGQELFNAIVLLLAAFMIGWTVIWMQRHGREIATRVKKIGQDVAEGNVPLYSVAIVVSLAMWREGSEIVLFMFGVISTEQYTLGSILLGGAGGSLAAASIGFLMYFGLIKLSMKHLFTVSGTLLMLLACGMAASGAGI